MTKAKWRDNWTQISVSIPMHAELKAEAEVLGCTIEAVIKAKLDHIAHLMMPDKQLVLHLQEEHPDQVHDHERGPEDDDRDYEEWQAYQEHRRKVKEVMERNKNKDLNKTIARSQAIGKAVKAKGEGGR